MDPVESASCFLVDQFCVVEILSDQLERRRSYNDLTSSSAHSLGCQGLLQRFTSGEELGAVEDSADVD